jgi:adenylate cyclase
VVKRIVAAVAQLNEESGAEATFAFINAYLRRLGPVVRKHGGFIDKYMGDSIMALFTCPAAALGSGVDMQRTVAEINAERVRQGEEAIRIGIGGNTGTAMLGVIGENERLEGTVIGDVVNLASRLEELTKHYGVPFLFGEDTLEAMAADV